MSELSKRLIDTIADSSTTALEELEQLVPDKPAINFIGFSDEKLGRATLDSLHMTVAKKLLFNNDAFKKALLISQTQVLRVINHLAAELAEKEPGLKRREWPEQLAKQYEDFYVLVYDRIILAEPTFAKLAA